MQPTKKKVVNKETGQEEDAEDLTNKPKNHFGLDELKVAWKRYAIKMQKEGNHSFFTTLSKRPPVLNDGYQVQIIIDNSVQEQNLAVSKAGLIEYLRDSLQNYQLSLEIKFNEKEDSVSLYTPKEKLKKLAEKNPAILKMIQKLDLDLEF